MKTLEIVYFIFLGLYCVIGSYFFLYRNNKVYKFRNYVARLNCDIHILDIETNIHNYIDYYDMLPSYNSMIFSFKSLKLESWFEGIDLKRLKTHKN